ncbi:hypothetical protein HXX76_008326 [Chlamydomonas incerta]|uniref:CHAP domain-containing protein n=1 Tax=Chlamydomonas incerta TaxID=51695 RepID=A0A835W111_CHLIN|nr:hypothetical protein HXX76_008326 [Chlamydomonas incerta]|eukprot:KAG2433258.1 hypothetical protein HXX76_008326 [Chlamydomonas incerta]
MGSRAERIAQIALANASSQSQGRCGIAVREAIEAATGMTMPRVGSAKDMGSSLVAVGFCFADAPLQVGDVAVIQDCQGHPHGHIQVWTGSQWVSDFVQRDFWPGPKYRELQPSSVIYRLR